MKQYENIAEELKNILAFLTKQTKHDDLKKRAWISIGEKLEIEGKATKVIWIYLKNVLSKGRIKT